MAANIVFRAASLAVKGSYFSTRAKVGMMRSMATYYTAKHEYINVEGNIGTIGITDFAQAALGDIVYVEVPEVDDEVFKEESFGSVESVKAASDVYSPVNGTVIESNENIVENPETVNEGAEGDGWFIKVEITDEGDLSDLMDEDAYKAHCEAEENA